MRNEDLPVIRRIRTDRDHVFAFAVVGRLTENALINLWGLLEAAYETHDEIDLLIRLTSYEGIDWTSAFSERMFELRSRSLRKVRRWIVVGGPLWIQASIALMKPFLSIDMRAFSTDEEEKAWEWLDAHPLQD